MAAIALPAWASHVTRPNTVIPAVAACILPDILAYYVPLGVSMMTGSLGLINLEDELIVTQAWIFVATTVVACLIAAATLVDGGSKYYVDSRLVTIGIHFSSSLYLSLFNLYFTVF